MGSNGLIKTSQLSALLVIIMLAALAVDPARAQVSPVPPGLVLPIGTPVKTWESGATNFLDNGTVNRVLAFKNGWPVETYYAPFPGNQGVPEILPSQPLYFVRMYAPGAGIGQIGSWVMRAAEVRGLTPEQIRDRFALPAVPTHITIVVVPPRVAALWTGYAGPIAQFGPGGGQQSYIMSKLAGKDEYTGANYPYIPLTSYLHGQAIGAQALSYRPLAGGGKAGQVAAYLDTLIPQPYSDAETVYNLLDYLNYYSPGPGSLRAALQQISPERYDAFSTLGVRASLLFGDALMQRSQTLRLGLAGSAGESAGSRPEALGRLARMASASSFSSPQTIASPTLPVQVSQRGIGVWGRGLGEFGDLASSGDRTGFVYQTGGFVGGVDWQPRGDVILGVGAAYLGTGMDWRPSSGNANIKYAKFGLYGSYFTPRFFIDGVFSGGVNWTVARRQITLLSDDNVFFPSLYRTAFSNQSGHDLAVHWRSGVNLALGNWYLTPMAGLAYFFLHQNSFEEQGAGGLNLNVDANQAQTLRSTLGARLARTSTAPSGGKITPELTIGWAHNFTLGRRVINASLAELGGSFATNGDNADANTLLAGAGVTAQLANGLAFSGGYHAEIGRGFNSHMLNLGVRYEY
jgi:outer membrane autotransporter protein